MNRFFATAALATVFGLGIAGTADAQYVQRYTTITPNGGVVVSNGYSTFGAFQTNNTYYSPYGGVKQQNYYGDVFGNTYAQSSGYNAFTGAAFNRNYGYNSFTGTGYNTAFYRPSAFIVPASNPFVSPYAPGGAYYNNYYYGRRY